MNFNRILPRLYCGAFGAFAIMFSAVSASAYDFSAKTGNGTDIFYNINPDGKTVTVTYGGSKYNVSSLEIPQEISHDGVTYTVTAIGNKAFQEAKVNVISLPNTITEFQTSAFTSSKLTALNYPTQLKYIRTSALSGVKITNGILPKGIECIEKDAFYGAPIDTLYLPNTLQTIGDNAFHGTKISYLTIPGSIKIVSHGAFSNCNNLKEVIIEEGVESLGSKPYDGSVFSACPLTKISFPASLTYIGKSTFNGNKFKELVLPNTIKEIGSSCFTNSSELESITFSSGMTEIPAYVCESSPKLIKVVIPNGIIKIGSMPFRSAELLSHITFPESVVELENGILAQTGIVDFKFPSNLTYIGSSMFENCMNLTEIVIPDHIKTIKNDAFSHCGNLRSVTFPENIESIEKSAFSGCSSLENITIPASVKEIKEYTFQDCYGLKKVVISEGVSKIERSVFSQCKNLSELVLPKSLTSIGSNFIGGCDAMRELTIYHQVETIEQGAFYTCKGLEKIHLHRAVLPSTPIPLGWLVDRAVIDEGNTCTLYVPTGSSEAYKSSKHWNPFYAIEEEAVTENLNYQLSFPWSISGGKLTVNGEATKNVMEFAMDSDVEIVAVPNTGYHLQALLVNGEDVTAAMTDGRYIISKIASNYTVDAKFAENPVKLSLFMAVGGSVDVDVEKKDTFSCTITPEKGWEINTVTFNGRNVTADLTDDNRYTTPALTGDSELRVTFENRDSAVKNIGIDATATKVYVDRDGVVTLEGLEPGVLINVYTVSGQFVNSATSNPGVTTMQLQQHGIYIIQTPAQTFKLQY